MDSHPQYSVLIPAYNEELLLPRTLAAVHAAFAAVGVSAYEVIVCDNNSTDRTPAVAQANGAQVVFEPHNQISRARNAAAERARGAWLLFLDADTLLEPPLLRATLQAIRAGGLCGGGALIAFDREDLGWFPLALVRLWNRVSATLNLAAGSWLFCLRTAWEGAGGFDSAIYAGEELYFSRAVKRWGRPRRLRFRILTSAAVRTSARKMDWYGPWALFRQVVKMMLPWSHRSRRACTLWYERPGEGQGVSFAEGKDRDKRGNESRGKV